MLPFYLEFLIMQLALPTVPLSPLMLLQQPSYTHAYSLILIRESLGVYFKEEKSYNMTHRLAVMIKFH